MNDTNTHQNASYEELAVQRHQTRQAKIKGVSMIWCTEILSVTGLMVALLYKGMPLWVCAVVGIIVICFSAVAGSGSVLGAK